MPMIEWNPRLSVGVKQFDDEHKQLISIINDLGNAMHAGRSKDALADILDRLVSYTQTHFSHEEQVMRSHGFPDLEKHIAEHRALATKAVDIQKQARQQSSTVLSMQTMNFLTQWLTTHIQNVDARYGAFLTAKGVK